jgi:hypothetical protein
MIVYQPAPGAAQWHDAGMDGHEALSNRQCSHFFIRLHISGAGRMAHEISKSRQVRGRECMRVRVLLSPPPHNFLRVSLLRHTGRSRSQA